MLNNIIFNNASNENMRTIEQVKTEIKDLELSISELKSEIDGFEYSLTEAEFDEYLDEAGEQHTSVGSFYPSNILKNCDPIAYHCAKSDYEGNFNLADCAEYADMLKELESLENYLEILENYLENLQDKLN